MNPITDMEDGSDMKKDAMDLVN